MFNEIQNKEDIYIYIYIYIYNGLLESKRYNVDIL